MNIKDGDVVTLDNGQIVLVTLTPVEIVPIPGKKYRLRYTGQFCHWCSTTKDFKYSDRNSLPEYTFQYMGEVDTHVGIRAIFFCKDTITYVMFSTSSYGYITQEVK